MKLTTVHSNTPPAQRPDLVAQMQDRSNYEYCLRHLSNNKAPGPDGIPDEVLRSLPAEAHTAIHATLVGMFMTGYISPQWCLSHTVLLHKKGDPLDPNNYRPIGLCNTIWGAMLGHLLVVRPVSSDHRWKRWSPS